MQCEKCNAELEGDNTFCTSCGAKVEKKKETKPDTAKNSKNKLIVGVVAALIVIAIAAFFLVPKEAEVICNKPYIQVGKDCCLDENSDSVCDKDEKTINDQAQEPIKPTTPVEDIKIPEETKKKESQSSNKGKIITFILSDAQSVSSTKVLPGEAVTIMLLASDVTIGDIFTLDEQVPAGWLVSDWQVNGARGGKEGVEYRFVAADNRHGWSFTADSSTITITFVVEIPTMANKGNYKFDAIFFDSRGQYGNTGIVTIEKEEMTKIETGCTSDVKLTVSEIGGTPQICYGGGGNTGQINFTLDNQGKKDIKELEIVVGGTSGIYQLSNLNMAILIAGGAMFRNITYDYTTYGKIKYVKFVPKIDIGGVITPCTDSSLQIDSNQLRNCSAS